MDPIIVGLGVALTVLITYMIISGYLTGAVGKEQDMTKAISAISADSLSKPDAQRYMYGMWLYVNAWPTVGALPATAAVPARTPIFTRNKDMELYLDGTTGKLVLNMLAAESTTTDTTKVQAITITNNFPIQKWVHIVISVDNKIVDLYLDGKLVKSVNISLTTRAPDVSSAITFTPLSSGSSAFMTKFSRVPAIADPQSVWNLYMQSSGTGTNGNGKLGVNLSLLKDNVETGKYAIR
jgi:hypothetical protein